MEQVVSHSILTDLGRRVCAGYKVAHNSMYIFFSRLLYCFDVEEDPVDSSYFSLISGTPD